MATIRLPVLPDNGDAEQDLDPSVFVRTASADGNDYACGRCGTVLVRQYDVAEASLQIKGAVIRCPACGARNAFSPQSPSR